MIYEHVFAEEPPIVIVEDDDHYFHIYAEGEHVGTCRGSAQAKEIATEVFEALTGDDYSEEAE